MKKGYTKSWRKELDGDIWKMPPLYNRVWYWLRQKASWEANIFPTAKLYGIWLLPGQICTSYEVIAKGVSWIEYGVEKTPNKKTIKQIVDWLVFNEMVTAVSNAYGTWIKIINWDTYNADKSEKVTVESNLEETQKKRPADTLKEVLNIKKTKKNVKNNTIGSGKWKLPEEINPSAWKDFEEHRKGTKNWSNRARTLNANVLKGNSFKDQQEIVDKSIRSGWPGLYPEKGQNKKSFTTRQDRIEQRLKDIGVKV